MMQFNPQNWFWVVGGSLTQVYSSANGDYVPLADPTYQAWLVGGRKPTRIDTEANLGQVLSGYLLQPASTSGAAGVLDGYKQTLASGIVAQAIFKVLFNHENRLRACERALALNGSPPNLTAAQALSAVKALL